MATMGLREGVLLTSDGVNGQHTSMNGVAEVSRVQRWATESRTVAAMLRFGPQAVQGIFNLGCHPSLSLHTFRSRSKEYLSRGVAGAASPLPPLGTC